MASKLIIMLECICIVFYISTVVKSQQNEYINKDDFGSVIHFNGDKHEYFYGLKRSFQIKEPKEKKNTRKGQFLK